MRKFIPFLLASAGLFAIIGVLFLLVRMDAMPARVRAFDWRKATVAPPAEPVEEAAA